jgi:quercetin dioxygenase-like cupin family protein
MTMPSKWVRALLIILSMAAAPRGAAAADEKDAGEMIAETPKNLKFIQIPDMPACATGAILRGDPRSGPAWVLLKLASGCRVPWHWHTANEDLVIVSGRGTLEMKDHPPLQFTPGAYASLPNHHVHQAKCAQTCMFFSIADAAFDIHYVDAKGEKISLKEALKQPPAAKARKK